MDDTLSRLLDNVRPRQVVVESDWTSGTVRCEAGAGLTVVTMVRGGSAVLAVDGTTPVELAAGDVALVIGAHGYSLSAEDALLVTGSYDISGGVCDRVLGGLPPVLKVDSGDEVAGAVGLLERELGGSRPGRRALLDRLLDLVLLTSLREWLDRPDSGAPQWYGAQNDPAIGAALDLIHTDPAHRWTVAELADRTTMSRAAFARRFNALVGEPPMSYLTCWRLCLASDLLRDTDDTLAAVARQVGYANAYALSAAFTRFYGVRPGEYRDQVA
ncbi:AraC family transcriptional regulator [Kribbella sp. DT2]|uniref:helix-turn-helix transcriptional regulator n=1 Tax=Kribbella sp. DT2 TaxID=3393427 RepID=UPI003CE92E82